MNIIAKNSLFSVGGGNYRLTLTDSFYVYTRRVRPFRSPRRFCYLNTTQKEDKQ
jgi:hypothetical protein